MTDPKAFLKTTRSAIGPSLSVAIGARLVQGLTGITAAWILSGVVNAIVFQHFDLSAVLPSLYSLMGLCGARALCVYGAEHAAFQASAAARQDLFRRLSDHLVALGPVRLAGTPTGDIASTLVEAVSGTDPFWRRWIPALAQASILPLAIIVLALPLDWLSGLVFLLTAPLLPIFMILVGKGAEHASQKQWTNLLRLGGYLLDAIKGLPDLKILRASKREIDTIGRMAENYRRDTMSVLRIAFLSALVLEFFATLSIAIVAVLVGFRLMWGEIDFRVGFFLLLLAPEFYAPLRVLGTQRHAKMEALAAAEKIALFLDRPLPVGSSGYKQPSFGKALSITFQGVSISYNEAKNALTDISLTIAPGEHIALVGPSGAGKTTLLAALAGFVEAYQGNILIDGCPLSAIDMAFWRRHLVYLPQKPHFFDDTILENISMGRSPLNGTVEETVQTALKAAQAEAFVSRLKDGTRTRLGEHGLGVSGGEAQRLALARAFYAPAPLVLFDEPTAHLDPQTERSIGTSIAHLAYGRTMITIAHRLSTVCQADRIIVLDQGRLIEQGSHTDLIAQGGLYATLVGTARCIGKRRKDPDIRPDNGRKTTA